MERYAVALRIRYCQRDEEGTVSEGETWAEGELTRAAEGWTLRYREPENEVEMSLLDGEVGMRRFAGGTARVVSEAVYRVGVEAPMRYEAAGYHLSFVLRPQVVCWRVEPPFVEVRLEYLLQVAGSQWVRHEVRVESEGCEGQDFRTRARALLEGALGARWGFVRWADREDALLVTDAGRIAARRGMASESILEEFTRAGWRVWQTEDQAGGLWWLDPPEEAFQKALRARWVPAERPFHGWRDGDLGELQALCATLLRSNPPKEKKEATLGEPFRALLREVWKHLDGPPASVNRWMRQATRRFAVARRNGDFTVEYAYGVLLARYLRRTGCGVP